MPMFPERFIKLLSSLRLTVVLLGFAILIVFFGTLAQVNEGLYAAQNRWFHSFIIWWPAHSTGWRLPILPGGYLVGSVLLANLVTAHLQRFKLTWSKLGIHVTHGGLILLLVGQLATDLLSRETTISFSEGEAKNYSVSPAVVELIFSTDAGGQEQVIAVPQSLLREGGEIKASKLSFSIVVKKYYPNADLRQRAPMVDKGAPPANSGVGPRMTLIPLPEVKTTDERNMPAMVVELTGAQGSLGTWVLHPGLNEQEVAINEKTWRMGLRFERHYYPFSVTLLKTTHEVYRGTDIPKNFQSRVRIENPTKHESREVDIYMNNPLRYEGLTFYQYQMGRDEVNQNVGTSALQVVRNPGWLTPYFGCALVGGGLVIQFLMHLVGFIKKRRTA
jgi:hypothetical protein